MTEIKVCGIKKEDDLLRLIDLNVTWAGFVFYKDSIRNVDYNHKHLFEIARNKIGIVCLFVNPRNEFISKMADQNILMTPMGEGKIRIVTHLDFTEEMLEKLLTEFSLFRFKF